jgi:hypothetical protein
MGNAYRFSVGEPEGKIPLDVGGKIILDWILEKMEWKCLDCVDLAQDRNQ